MTLENTMSQKTTSTQKHDFEVNIDECWPARHQAYPYGESPVGKQTKRLIRATLEITIGSNSMVSKESPDACKRSCYGYKQ